MCSLSVSKDQYKINVNYVFPQKNLTLLSLSQVPKGFINRVHMGVLPSQSTLESLGTEVEIQIQSKIQAWPEDCNPNLVQNLNGHKFKWVEFPVSEVSKSLLKIKLEFNSHFEHV